MLIECIECHEKHHVPITEAQVAAWRGGLHIQHAMPNITPGQREMLLSGVCSECYDRAFEEDDSQHRED